MQPNMKFFSIFIVIFEKYYYLCAMVYELTEKMHSEFTISKETEIRHRAGCVWLVLDKDAPKEQVEEQAHEYGITYEEAMKYRDYWNEKK